MYPSVHHSAIYNSYDMEAAQMAIDGWIKKLPNIYIVDYYSAIKTDVFESFLF